MYMYVVGGCIRIWKVLSIVKIHKTVILMKVGLCEQDYGRSL